MTPAPYVATAPTTVFRSGYASRLAHASVVAHRSHVVKLQGRLDSIFETTSALRVAMSRETRTASWHAVTVLLATARIAIVAVATAAYC